MNTTVKPDCYKCVHRANLVGDCHSACTHPQASPAMLFSGDNPLQIAAHSHGVDKGWFLWPLNYDPIWLVACAGFTPKDPPDGHA